MPVYTNALAPRPSNSLAYGPRNLMGTQMLQRPSESYLRQQFPGLYGALGGLLATAPDVMEGSVLDPNTAAVRQAAEYTFPIGTALGMLPGVGTGQKVAMTVGRAGERLAERAVPQIMGRGGLGAEMLSGMAQDTASNMAERVGKLKAIEALFPGKTEAMLLPAEKAALTKYKSILDTPAVMRREQARLFGTGDIVQPSLNVAQEMGVHPNALLDKYVVPILWDTSATGGNVTQIAGIPLTKGLKDATPAFVQRQGGRLYPYIQENLQQGVGGASNVSAQSSKINNLNKFSDLGDTIGVQMNLAPSGINFSHHMAESYVGALNAIKPSREALTSFRDAVRNTKVENPVTKEISYPYKNFPGIDSPNIREIMAEGTKEYSPGNIRKAIAETGEKAKIQDLGFPRWQDVYNVMSEPGAETGRAHTLLSVQPKAQMITPNFEHGSYNAGFPAKLMGSLQNAQGEIVGIPDYLMMPKLFAQRQAQGKTLSNIRTSLLKSHTGELLDQQAIDNIAKYLGY